MRINAGKWKGRPLFTVDGLSTRPTPDMVKQAVFNIIRDRVEGSLFCDMFAGTGSVAFEALSRGARHITLVENGRDALNVIKRNSAYLGCASDMTLVSNDVFTISNHSGVSATYTSYIYDTNKDLFVEGDEAPTTTTTTAAETTTTTTTTTTSEADLEAAKKALYEVYAAKYKPAVSGYETVEYHIVDGVLTSATIVVEDQDEKVVKTFFVTKDGATLINSVRMGGMWYGFKSTDFTCNGYQFYAQIVQPASDADVRSYLTIYVYDKDGNLVPTNING